MEGDQDRPGGPEGPDQQPEPPAHEPTYSDQPGAAAPAGMGPPGGVPGGYGLDAAPEPATRRWLSGARLTALVTVVVLAIAAAAVAVVLSSTESPALEEVVPANALVFAKADLIPSGEQRDALLAILERFPFPEGKEPGEAIRDLLDENTAEEDFQFERDLAPWLGGEIGFAITSINVASGDLPVQFAVVAAARDPSLARSTLEGVKERSREPFFFDVRDGVAFIAPDLLSLERALSVVDGAASPLAEDAGFTGSLDRAGRDNLGFAWFNGDRVQELVPPGMLPQLPTGLGGGGTAVMVLRAEENALVVEGVSSGAQTPPPTGAGTPTLLEASPSRLLGALTFFDLAATFEPLLQAADTFLLGFTGPMSDAGTPPSARALVDGFLEGALSLRLDRDIEPWLHGEISIVVGRFSLPAPEIGILIESTDDDAAARTVDALRTRLGAIGQEAGFEVTSAPGGLAITFDAGFSLIVRRVAGRVVIASTDAYADELLTGSADALADDTVYHRAVGPPGQDDVGFQMFVRVDRIASLLEVFLPPSEYEDARPYLEQFEAFGVRGTASGEEGTFRMVLTFKER